MNELLGITLLFESLIPIEKAERLSLSVGTVTLLLSETEELPLDFQETQTAYDTVSASSGRFYVILNELNPHSFLQEYKAIGMSQEDFTYDFFRSHRSSTYVSEVYTEAYIRDKKIPLPLTLKKMHLYFTNGLVLDYIDRISVFALAELAEVA